MLDLTHELHGLPLSHLIFLLLQFSHTKVNRCRLRGILVSSSAGLPMVLELVDSIGFKKSGEYKGRIGGL